MRDAIIKSSTIILITTIMLGVAEGFVRMTWTPPSLLSDPQMEPHSIYGWAPIPGATGQHVTMEFRYSFAHTDQGLRGTEHIQHEKPAGISRRMLFLGGSFTYGVGSGDNEIFVQRLAAVWPDVQVINAGISNFGQAQELALLDTFGAAVEPDLVILMFSWSDLEDNTKENIPRFGWSEDSSLARLDMAIPDDYDPLASRSPVTRGAAKREDLLRRTYLYKLFKEGAEEYRHDLFGIRPRSIQTPEQQAIAWRKTRELLSLIDRRVAEMGAELVIFSMPEYSRVDPEMSLRGLSKLNTEVEQDLARLLSELGIAYVDLLPGLRRIQAETDEPLYYKVDRHLTPRGNAAVAQIMESEIESYLH